MKVRSLLQQLIVFVIFTGVFPAFGIVIPSSTTAGAISDINYYLAPYDTVKNGVNLNGVVLVGFGGGTFCSGALISPTQVLTAAHCFGSSPTVNFIDSSNNLLPIVASSFEIDPDFSGFPSSADLAIINLSSVAPSFATIYRLFTGIYTNGATITIAGFGYSGNGDTGATTGGGTRMVGENSYDTNGTFDGLGPTLRVGDFDNGNAANNAIPGSGLGLPDEVDISHGDSGGPSFYNGQLIGIHNFIDCVGTGSCSSPPSVQATGAPNSYYGELFGDTSVDANATWIQSVITPEPSTWLLCCGALALQAMAVRRRAKRHDSR